MWEISRSEILSYAHILSNKDYEWNKSDFILLAKPKFQKKNNLSSVGREKIMWKISTIYVTYV